MITHTCIKLALHGQEETLWRELYVPPFLYLNDLAAIINLCFGWPDDIHYTFYRPKSRTSVFLCVLRRFTQLKNIRCRGSNIAGVV